MAKAQKKSKPVPKTSFGLCSKREGAKLIANGVRHVHSSALGIRDSLAKATQTSIESGKVPQYSWEKGTATITATVKSSKDRFDIIKMILARPEFGTRRDLKERVQTVLEELLTNAIFHSYNNADGSPKYRRLDAISLAQTEWVHVEAKIDEAGICLKVKDAGGSHRFKDISDALARCYLQKESQIQTKEGGAGLGLYMIFDAATHWKIFSRPNRDTTITLWISDKKNYDPDTFSFNFFEEE
jgi:anti-sigma regulatory factor (Ser/Thr protein kinase)